MYHSVGMTMSSLSYMPALLAIHLQCTDGLWSPGCIHRYRHGSVLMPLAISVTNGAYRTQRHSWPAWCGAKNTGDHHGDYVSMVSSSGVVIAYPAVTPAVCCAGDGGYWGHKNDDDKDHHRHHHHHHHKHHTDE